MGISWEALAYNKHEFCQVVCTRHPYLLNCYLQKSFHVHVKLKGEPSTEATANCFSRDWPQQWVIRFCITNITDAIMQYAKKEWKLLENGLNTFVRSFWYFSSDMFVPWVKRILQYEMWSILLPVETEYSQSILTARCCNNTNNTNLHKLLYQKCTNNALSFPSRSITITEWDKNAILFSLLLLCRTEQAKMVNAFRMSY